MKSYPVRINLHQEEDGRWSASAPDLPGCGTWGHTREEALKYIQEAVALYIESLIDRKLPIPPAVNILDEPVVTVTVCAA